MANAARREDAQRAPKFAASAAPDFSEAAEASPPILQIAARSPQMAAP
jgi:hypothetical protein